MRKFHARQILCGLFVFFFSAALYLTAVGHTERNPQSAGAKNDKLAATYFFYWYDVYSGFHVKWDDGGDQLQDHPPASRMNTYSFKELSWYKKELLDMMAAGIDVVLPVFWDLDSDRFWSIPGTRKLAAAAQILQAEGHSVPKIGLFCDTTALSLQNGGIPPDVTKKKGKEQFYHSIADFFRQMPQDLWATIDGHPIVFLYYSEYVKKYNKGTFSYIYQRFEEEFGTKPYIVREASWEGVKTEGRYHWGVALNGPQVFDHIGSLGPGYDETATRRKNPRIRERDGGEFYRSSWEKIINSSPKLVAIETWNEWHEGTDVAPSREYGNFYRKLTAQYIKRWKDTNFDSVTLVWADLGRDSYGYGLSSVEAQDGVFSIKKLAGREAAYPDITAVDSSHYIYFKMSRDFRPAKNNHLWITVEYFDVGTGLWGLDYDGLGNPVISATLVRLHDTGMWRRYTFHLTDAYCRGRLNGVADFRLSDYSWWDNQPNYFGRVWVSKRVPQNSAPDMNGIDDVTLKAGKTKKILLHAADPDGDNINYFLHTELSFLKLINQGGGKWILKISPKAKDVQKTFYRVVILAQDSGEPSLADAVKFKIRVKKK